MENCTHEDVYSAKMLLDLYIDLVENKSKDTIYLSDNVVLDWFGKTIKESKKVTSFIKEQVCKVTHELTNVFPSENIAFKKAHHVKIPKNGNLAVPVVSHDQNTTTPPKAVASTSMVDIRQDHDSNPLMSPPKKIKLGSTEENNETIEGETEEPSLLKYITAEGTVEFHRPSIKKFQSETKWKRPIKLHLGYTSNGFKDCTIYLIIYEGNLKCRRNLFKEFCQSESSTEFY